MTEDKELEQSIEEVNLNYIKQTNTILKIAIVLNVLVAIAQGYLLLKKWGLI